MKRWPFLALFFVNAIAVGILVAYGQGTMTKSIHAACENILAKIPALRQCNTVQYPHCIENQAIFRASMAIGVFFLFMMVWSALTEWGHNRGCAILALELPLYLGLSIGAFFLPNSVFDVYAWIAAVASGVFIVMQIVILLDCVYGIRDFILEKIQATPESRQWPAVFITLSMLSLIATIVGLVLLYVYYSALPLAVVFITITAVFVVVLPVLGVSDKIGSGLLPPAAMTMYLVFLCWQAVSKIPNFSPSFATGPSASPILVPSAIIGALTVSWTSWRTSESTKSLFRLEMHPDTADKSSASQASNGSKEAPVEPSSGVVAWDKVVVAVPEDATPPLSSELTAPSWQFFFIMFVSSFYMAMVMTNWGVNGGTTTPEVVCVWVQIVSQWVTGLFFLWSLVAPLLLPHRDFS
ncbi:hypothetical protein H310_04500 [Aphanomyces invadans]|uniref:TMS membrane protein/tumor differentially expressed protein n=1 Tax=Aphanomyces invadans TaxID=157072 RepID=A0A024UD00_9STRA|nr:hypothetical protein H310_04500 [Aphanomyces invadans]ETW04144.1 hypothetical protein H310_04500 [Aphanomyces invadans]|eukprot:XP_008867100.1 hypothetical protein H310_04500 [Aphanomyces invadans]